FSRDWSSDVCSSDLATIEVLSQDYVRTATAKGLSRQMVVLRHAVRNALLPVVTVIGFRIAFLFSGTIIIENIFAIPGIGRLFIEIGRASCRDRVSML